MNLKNKTLIVTGASSGIGAAAALLFAAEGANLVIGARRQADLDRVAGQINQSNGRAVALSGDVAEAGFAEALVARAEDEFGGLDGALNNAGTMGAMSPIPDMPDAVWNEVIATNLSSAFYAARAQIPAHPWLVDLLGASFLGTYAPLSVLKFALFDRFIFVDRTARTPGTTSAP